MQVASIIEQVRLVMRLLQVELLSLKTAFAARGAETEAVGIWAAGKRHETS